jgi:hypothetical protein
MLCWHILKSSAALYVETPIGFRLQQWSWIEPTDECICGQTYVFCAFTAMHVLQVDGACRMHAGCFSMEWLGRLVRLATCLLLDLADLVHKAAVSMLLLFSRTGHHHQRRLHAHMHSMVKELCDCGPLVN